MKGLLYANQAAREAWPSLRTGTQWDEFRASVTSGWMVHLHPWLDSESFLVECHPDLTAPLAERLQALREAYEELELIVSEAFDEVFVTDGNGVTLRVNRAAERLYGLRQEELVGRSVYDLERDGLFYPSVIGLALKLRREVTVLQKTSDGKQLWATANPVFDAQGNIRLVISTAKEVSDAFRPHTPGFSTASEGSGSGEAIRGLVAHSQAMQRVLEMARRVARADLTCLLLGETGVGKSTLAEWIHRMSPRHSGPFVEVNCAALPESLLESELFGYESGAFTGASRSGKPGKVELAHGGTLFLDEIAEIPLHLQGKLLDFVERRAMTRVGGTTRRHVDARIIAATNRDVKRMVREGTFRADLYYRLHGVSIEIPPLRERKEDIPVLIDQFLEDMFRTHPTMVKRIHPQVVERLQAYRWPGNVRELEHLVKRLVLLTDGDGILPSDLREEWLEEDSLGDVQTEGIRPLDKLAQVEREIYAEAARRCRSSYEVAEALGVSQATAVRKLKKYGLSIWRTP